MALNITPSLWECLDDWAECSLADIALMDALDLEGLADKQRDQANAQRTLSIRPAQLETWEDEDGFYMCAVSVTQATCRVEDTFMSHFCRRIHDARLHTAPRHSPLRLLR